jgi:N-methylhydantoinase A
LTEQIQSLCRSGSIHVERFLDLRYQGQSYELSIRYDNNFEKVFHETHKHHFGYLLPDAPLELVSIRCTIRMESALCEIPRKNEQKRTKLLPEQMVTMTFDTGQMTVPVCKRSLLKPGHTLQGPVLIVDNYTTTLVQEKYQLYVDALSNIVLTPLN